ncbi:hypothetical protein [Phocaeicola salanitronis]|nr:hypothetical protein [Phocaeicola salanitronis]
MNQYNIHDLFYRRGGVCPPENIIRSIHGCIRAGKPCPYRYIG